ncbi:ABC transporter permease [Rhizobium wenxiniae]|uniref:NitT/TauT family transport system permease protein n=1 Tax=Rhizobium wenxiniae TaxID=1737357 RepID=A0A7X0D0J0_9HYPH|nr:ABC transporter permease subunit [Rhizobium wenxiniae]MBB6163452.1 NitT/TauT family transport system permease protein [Rhizobium wenxiniae]GGG08593.1 ABC transporter permease [Rhizobium wenxiniae]
MPSLVERVSRTAQFLWSGWSGLAGLSVFAAFWQVAHEAYGSFILPSPLETLAAAKALLGEASAWQLLLTTSSRALSGFALAGVIGTVSGCIAGFHPAILRLVQPQITLMLGVPPIAWIVLLMIWFGTGSATVTTTAAVACLPIVFLGAAEGIASRDRLLDDMALSLGMGRVRRFFHITVPQMLNRLLPILVMALGTAFKAAVMAELLANAGGIGEALAVSRSNLDVANALAWILLSVSALLGVEYGLIQPTRSELEVWRHAARPWGVKR